MNEVDNMILQQITGIENLPEFGKFRVHLECGHSILYDHSVDAVGEYLPTDGKSPELICFMCEEK